MGDRLPKVFHNRCVAFYGALCRAYIGDRSQICHDAELRDVKKRSQSQNLTKGRIM